MKWIVIKENWQTTKHKLQIIRYMTNVCCKLMKRAIMHDVSKFSEEEAPHFAAAGQTKDIQYDSPEYKESLKKLESALRHHYEKNSHHPQHFKNGFPEMQPLDVIEMLVDWKASTTRYKSGDVRDSIEINKKRFKYSEQVRKNFEKFYREIKAW